MHDRDSLLYEVAVLYYEKEYTQSKIAEELGFSRPTIASMLKEAKDRGIVTITINKVQDQERYLQDKIKTKYGLTSVYISQKNMDSEETKRHLGIVTASFIEHHLDAISSIGLGWGTTLHHYVQAASYINANVESIVPLIGGVSINEVKYHANHLAFQLADKYQSDANNFYAPAVAENEEIYNAFVHSGLVSNALQAAKKVDTAIISPDNPYYQSTLEKLGYVTEEDKLNLEKLNVVGDVLTSFYDKNGNVVENDISKRMLGLTIDDLKEIENVVVIASGSHKNESVKALLKTGAVNHLVIDVDIARFLKN